MEQLKKNLWKYRQVIVWGICMLLAEGLLIWKARYGFGSEDEPFYLTIAHRLVKGDGLISEEWHLSQLSAVLLYPIMKLYLAVSGTTEGILLHFRYIFIAAKTLIAAGIYLCLRKKYGWAAVAGSVLYFIFTPYDIMQIYYNTVGVSLFLLAAALVLGFYEEAEKKKRNLAEIGAGIVFACAVLGCPYLVAVYMIFMVLVLGYGIIRKERDVRALAWNVTIGCVITAVIFFLFLFSRTGITEMISNIPEMLKDPEHNTVLKSVATRHLYEAVKTYYKVTILGGMAAMAGITVCGIAGKITKKHLVWKTDFIWIGLYAVCMGYNVWKLAEKITQNYNVVMIPVTGLGILFFYMMLWENGFKRAEKGPALLWLFGCLYGELLNISSNNMLNAFAFAMTVSMAASFLLVYDYGRRKEEKSYVLPVILTAVVLLQGVVEADSVMHHVYWEDDLSELHTEITEGPLKGVITSEEHAAEYEQKIRDLDWFKGKETGSFVYFSACSWSYLYLDMDYATHSAWSGEYEVQYEMDMEYWKLHPEKIPQYIYLEQCYSSDAQITEDAEKYGYDCVKLGMGYGLEKRGESTIFSDIPKPYTLLSSGKFY